MLTFFQVDCLLSLLYSCSRPCLNGLLYRHTLAHTHTLVLTVLSTCIHFCRFVFIGLFSIFSGVSTLQLCVHSKSQPVTSSRPFRPDLVSPHFRTVVHSLVLSYSSSLFGGLFSSVSFLACVIVYTSSTLFFLAIPNVERRLVRSELSARYLWPPSNHVQQMELCTFQLGLRLPYLYLDKITC